MGGNCDGLFIDRADTLAMNYSRAQKTPIIPVSPAPAPETVTRLLHIDGLRACACLAVFFHHCWMNANQPQLRLDLLGKHVNILRLCMFGNTGVHLFLLLSGFCLFYSFAGPGGLAKFHLANFARKRCWRILPAYYAACVVCLLLPFALGYFNSHAGSHFYISPFPGAASLALHAILLHGLYAPALYGINGVFWSLSLEWQFYFTFPLLAWLFHKKGPWFVIGLVGCANLLYRVIVYRYFLTPDPTWNWTLCSVFIGRWLEFCLGMLAAWQLRQSSHESRSRVPSGVFIAAGILFALAGAKAPTFSPFNDIFWGCFYYCILRASFVQVSALRRVLSLKPLVWLGGISYSFYLLHMPILSIIAALLAHRMGQNAIMGLLVALGLVITGAAAFAFYKTFEEPYFNRTKKSIVFRNPLAGQ